MNLDEIARAFKNCNGDSPKTLKEYLSKQSFSPENYSSGVTLSKVNNYIFSDIERLLSKSIINILCADILLKNCHMSWGFVTSYYSSFFSIQALNRLQLNFNLWVKHSIICRNVNYVHQEIKLLKADQSKGSHENQFKLFFENYKEFKNRRIDRYWNIGLSSFYGSEPGIRNEINYSLSDKHFNELSISPIECKKIIKQLIKSPFIEQERSNKGSVENISRNAIMMSLSRIRIIVYILNFIANSNAEYKSYFIRNSNRRLDAISKNYSSRSDWLYKLLEEWLCFSDMPTDNNI